MEGIFILIVIGVVGFKIYQFFREEMTSPDEFEIDLKPPLIKRAATPVRRVVESEDEISVSEPVVFSLPSGPTGAEPPPLKVPAPEVAVPKEKGETAPVKVAAPEPDEPAESVQPEPKLVEPERMRIVPEDDSLDLYEAAQSVLFGEGGHYAATQRFSSTFQGERLEGGGRLVRVDRFSNDRFFGRGPGTMATVEVDIYSDEEPERSKTISVLLALPEESRDEMKPLVGETVRVGGTAIRCDVFSSKLYLVESET